MNSDDLAVFALVAETGSFSSAALAWGVDASSISRRMTQLEKTLGARLFHRTGRGVSVTAQGAALLIYAEQVRDTLAAAQTCFSLNARQRVAAPGDARGTGVLINRIGSGH